MARRVVADAVGEVEDALRAYFRQRQVEAFAHGESFSRLWRVADENARGGKLVRPRLLLDMFHALAPTHRPSEGDAAIDIAIALELLHYSFLLHDDVIDGDLVRRGRPNVIGALIAEAHGIVVAGTRVESEPGIAHWARSGAILMGNLLLASVHQLIARANVSRATSLRLMDLLEDTVTESVAGEELDVALSHRIVGPDLPTILAMTRQKTAAYTFGMPLRAAAALAGVDAALERALALAGRHMGMAYQLQDDVLSLCGDPAMHGKDPFSDLREGKHTALIAYARQTSAWCAIEPCFGSANLTDADGLRVRRLLESCGAQRFVEDLIAEQFEACRAVVESTDAGLPEAAQTVLRNTLASMEGRVA